MDKAKNNQNPFTASEANAFSRQISDASDRLELLMHRAGQSPLQEREALPEAFQELMTALEEMRVADAELRAQNEELVESRNQTEAEKRRYAELFDFAPDAYFLTFTDGTIREANRAALKLLNVSKNALIGKHLLVYVPEADRRAFRSHLIQFQNPERIEEWEARVQPRHGSPVDVAIKVGVMRDLNGTPTGLRWLIRDITERKRAEEAKRHSEFLSEASRLLSASLDYEATVARVARLGVPTFADLCAIYVRGEGGRIERVEVALADLEKEKQFAQIERRFPADANPKHPVSRILSTGKRRFVPEVNEAFLEDMALNAEHLCALKEFHFKSYIGLPLRTHGRMVGVIAFVALESGRRLNPADLGVAEDLARRAAIAVENARLYQQAQAAVSAHNQSLSMTLHEVRTPLTVIQGSTHLLKLHLEQALAALEVNGEGAEVRRPLDRATIARNLQNIEHATQRLITHINELMDITQIQSRSLVMTPEPLNLVDVISDVVENVKLEQQQGRYPRTTELRVTFPQNEAVRGNCDRQRIEQVLFNLIDNAIKYSPKGGEVEINLAIEDCDDDELRGPCAHLCVTDQGIGIEPQEHERIFEPFVRGTNASSRNISGIGVGLAISKEIVERHKGRIWVESTGNNEGSTFHVLLPLAE